MKGQEKPAPAAVLGVLARLRVLAIAVLAVAFGASAGTTGTGTAALPPGNTVVNHCSLSPRLGPTPTLR